MATKAIEDKRHEMEATMVNLGDKVGSNIQQGLNNLPVAGVAGVMGVAGAGGKRFEGDEILDQESPVPSQVLKKKSKGEKLNLYIQSTPPIEEKSSWYTLQSVKMIDNYSRRIFPTAYILFVLYFFIRYMYRYILNIPSLFPIFADIMP